MLPHYLDPTNDIAFKKVFGDENHKEVLISFLNSILGFSNDKEIIHIDYLDANQAPKLKGAKETIVDVKCKDQRGDEYIVEMQVLKQAFFDKRILYYASHSYSSQLENGESFPELRPVIFLGILNFQFTKNSHYLSTHLLRDVETDEHIIKDFQFNFIELTKFQKTQDELDTIVDKWVYFLKEATHFSKPPPSLQQEPAISQALETLDRFQWTRSEIDIYIKTGMAVRGALERDKETEEKGIKKGMEIGGEKERNKIATSLLKEGLSIPLIAKTTLLDEKLIQALAAKLPQNQDL